jgi:hypothetical protein
MPSPKEKESNQISDSISAQLKLFLVKSSARPPWSRRMTMVALALSGRLPSANRYLVANPVRSATFGYSAFSSAWNWLQKAQVGAALLSNLWTSNGGLSSRSVPFSLQLCARTKWSFRSSKPAEHALVLALLALTQTGRSTAGDDCRRPIRRANS